MNQEKLIVVKLKFVWRKNLFYFFSPARHPYCTRLSKADSEPYLTSKVELFAKIVRGF